jgi:hypothetical protein
MQKTKLAPCHTGHTHKILQSIKYLNVSCETVIMLEEGAKAQPVISATWEAEKGGMRSKGSLGMSLRPDVKNQKQRDWGRAQVIDCFPSRCEAPSSSPVRNKPNKVRHRGPTLPLWSRQWFFRFDHKSRGSKGKCLISKEESSA